MSMLVFALYAAPMSVGLGLILWLTKVNLEGNELGSFFISIALWSSLMVLMGRGKSLANLAIEPWPDGGDAACFDGIRCRGVFLYSRSPRVMSVPHART